MQVTGPKTDIWLVKMVGLLTVSIAIMLLVAARKNATGILILAICAALSYMAIDIYYVLDGTIDKIYLADAVVECILLLLFIFSRKNR